MQWYTDRVLASFTYATQYTYTYMYIIIIALIFMMNKKNYNLKHYNAYVMYM